MIVDQDLGIDILNLYSHYLLFKTVDVFERPGMHITEEIKQVDQIKAHYPYLLSRLLR